MKEAMWRVDAAGDFVFSDATDAAQPTMFSQPNYAHLKRLILDKFGGREARIEEIAEFVLADTAFRETHFKTQILKPLEANAPPQLEVVRPVPGRRKGTFPNGTIVRFP